MAAPKNTPSAEQAKGDIQKKADKETEQGFVGVAVDQTPNEEYTLQTGPDSPPHVADANTPNAQSASVRANKE